MSILPESAKTLQRTVSGIRRKVRAQLLLKALLSAVAADLLYDVAGIGLVFATGYSIYFPPFFFIVLALFVLVALRRTRTRAFYRRLDREFRLKDRLAAAYEYRRSGSIPPAIVEAQARESLGSVDFSSLRRSLRLRPGYHLAAVALLGGTLALIVWRNPGLYTPGNYLYRQGSAILSRFEHPPVDAEQVFAPGDGQDDEHPRTPFPEEEGEEEREPEAAAEEEAGEPEPEEAPAEKERAAPEPPEPEPVEEGEEARHPVSDDSGAGRERAGEGEAPRAGPSNTGGTTSKSPSVEVTDRPSPLIEKPYTGLAPESARLDAEGAGGYLPPIPLFKLLGGPSRGSFFDPETIYIVPEAYHARYREHIVAYFEKLQTFRGGRDGS